jgi:hypothetical protein
MRSSSMKGWPASLAAAGVLLCAPLWAGDPASASYCQENDRIFWFMTITDTHIGTSGSQDTNNLSWVVHEGKSVVDPSFIVLSGDITDSTNGNWLGIPNGPYQEEWDEYRATLDIAHTGINAGNFFDIPGNHDAYSDGSFSYYLSNSVQGQATGRAQASWTRTFDFGTYHFLGANTSANDGAAFSLSFPYGDYAGLDSDELAFLGSELSLHSDAALTIVFGHHPMEDTGYADDTWLFYGAPGFATLLQNHGVSSYTYGHTHRFGEAFFTQGEDYETGTPYTVGPGVFYINIDSLGKSSDNHFNITAIDCNGISTVTREIGSWPVVMITTPMDRSLGTPANPYVTYTVPRAADNPLRVLLFDTNTLTATAEYRIDSATTWYPMSRVAEKPKLWEAAWDASELSEGEHTIEVRATGSAGGSDTDTVSVYVEGTALSYIDQFATGEIPGAGTVSGSYADTLLPDGVSETITERSSGGKPSNRYSYLEHTWTLPVQAGATMVLNAQVDPDDSADGDAFEFAYSTDNSSFTPLFTTSGAESAAYSAVLPADFSGTLYVRVRDTDRTAGNRTLDSVAVDHLYVRTGFEAGEPPAAPSSLTASALSSSQIALAWSDNSDNELGFRVERFEGGLWSEAGTVPADAAAFTDSGLQPATAYTYRVSAYNGSGSSAPSNEATATTDAGAPISLDVTASKVRGVNYADLTWNGAETADVDIYRDGSRLTTVPNTGSYSNNLGKKPASSYTYRVCETGGSGPCSDDVTVSF